MIVDKMNVAGLLIMQGFQIIVKSKDVASLMEELKEWNVSYPDLIMQGYNDVAYVKLK